MTQVSFHIVRRFSLLSSVAESFYGTVETAAAREFLRINTAVPTEGYVWPGNVLFLPDLMPFHPDHEHRVIKLLAMINSSALQNLSVAEREFFAANHALVNNTVNHPSLIPDYAGGGTDRSGGLLEDISVQSRLIGDRLQELESCYLHERRTKGGLTPHFFAHRQAIYDALDGAMGRVASNLTTGEAAERQGKPAAWAGSSNRVLHWKTEGTEDPFKGFRQHYEKMQKVARYFRYGGCLAIGIDASLTYEVIARACESGEALACATKGPGEDSGSSRKLEGAGGALLGCSVRSLLEASSIDRNRLWCALLGRASISSRRAFRKGADFLFESSYAVS